MGAEPAGLAPAPHARRRRAGRDPDTGRARRVAGDAGLRRPPPDALPRHDRGSGHGAQRALRAQGGPVSKPEVHADRTAAGDLGVPGRLPHHQSRAAVRDPHRRRGGAAAARQRRFRQPARVRRQQQSQGLVRRPRGRRPEARRSRQRHLSGAALSLHQRGDPGEQLRRPGGGAARQSRAERHLRPAEGQRHQGPRVRRGRDHHAAARSRGARPGLRAGTLLLRHRSRARPRVSGRGHSRHRSSGAPRLAARRQPARVPRARGVPDFELQPEHRRDQSGGVPAGRARRGLRHAARRPVSMGAAAGGEGLLRGPERRLVRAREPARPERLPRGLLHPRRPDLLPRGQALRRHVPRGRQSRHRRRARYAAARVRSQARRHGRVADVPVRDPQRVPRGRRRDHPGDRAAHAHGQPAREDPDDRRDLPRAARRGAAIGPHEIRSVQPPVPPRARPQPGGAAARLLRCSRT